MKLSHRPKQAKTDAKDAWWYENRGSIDVIVQTENGTFSVRIYRRKLADYMRRSEK